MDAAPILAQLAALLERHGLEAILVGNAGAALQGAPVTTVDLDFLFRKTPANIAKLKKIARELDAVVYRPFYPATGMFRVSRDSDNLQVDFMVEMDGVRSFKGLRNRAKRVPFGEAGLSVASLADIIKSKKAAGRPKDLAVLHVLENALAETSPNPKDASRTPEEGK
jgi:hypothetical protein